MIFLYPNIGEMITISNTVNVCRQNAASVFWANLSTNANIVSSTYVLLLKASMQTVTRILPVDSLSICIE